VSNQLKIAARRAFVRAPGVIAHYPCFQSVAEGVFLIDRSGAGNGAAFGANLSAANAWANANYLTTAENVSGTNAGAPYLTGAQLGWDINTQSLLMAGVVNVTSSATHGAIMGNGSSATIRGIAVRVTQNDDGTVGDREKPRMLVYGASTVFGNVGGVAVGGAGDIHIALAVDGPAQRAYLFVGGEYDAAANGNASFSVGIGGLSYASVAADLPAAALANPLMFNAQPHTGTYALSANMKSNGWVVAKRTGNLPSNLAAVVKRLSRQPHQVLSSTEWPA